MISLTLVTRAVTYNGGDPIRESEALLDLSGPNLWNKGLHQVVDFGEASKCCRHVDKLPRHLHTSPEVTVIADRPQARPESHAAVCGDRVTIDGADWVIIAQREANPVLIRTEHGRRFALATWPYPLIQPKLITF